MEETTVVAVKSVEKKLRRHLKAVDKNVSVSEVLGDLGIDCEECGTAIESFKVTGVAPAIANAVQNDTNLKAAAEYISLLYREVREQEGEFQEFEKLYFGMKVLNNFMEKKENEETISFGGIVSGFTDKKKVIQFLSKKNSEEDNNSNLPSGVLFKVQNAKGYNIGKLSDGKTDEVLFEVNSAFKIEAVKEVIRERYVVVKLSYVSL